MTETRDDLDSRRWYGDMKDRPALANPDDVARTQVSIDGEVIEEYRDRVAFNDPQDLGDVLVAGVVSSATVSQNGYRIVEVLDVLEEVDDDGDRDRLVVGVIVTSGVLS